MIKAKVFIRNNIFRKELKMQKASNKKIKLNVKLQFIMKIFLKNNIKNIHLRVFKLSISFMQLINWTEIVFMLIYYIIHIGAEIITVVIIFLKTYSLN